MGCGASKDIPIDPIDVPETESGYPPPKPPREPRDKVYKDGDCAAIEANAKRAPSTVAQTYEALISYVTQNARTDVQKVRAIYAWLSAQPIYTMKYSNVTSAQNPEGYMKTIKQGNGSYTAFFALLCRAAKIPCVILRGVGKAASYEVGDQDVSELPSSWTAVHVDGAWRLVHVFWALVGLEGFSTGGWTTLEQGGKAVRQKEKASEGKTVHHQEDFWFLTDPDQFIYFCRASKSEWQLLKSPWTMDKFVNVPHFSRRYFTSGFKLTSQHTAILKSQKGTCNVTFQHSDSLDADLDYVLLFDEQNSKEKLPSSLQLERYVIQLGTQKEKSLRVRFPVRGIYKLKVSGSSTFKTLLASFRLNCDDTRNNVQPYPINPQIGFGYNKLAEDIGLARPSHVKGIVIVRHGETVKFQFHCRAKLDLQTHLVHKDRGAEELASHVKQDRSGDDVTVTVKVPDHAQNPEYALQVNARQEGSGGKYDNVINYLLTDGSEETEEGGKDKKQDNDQWDEDRLRQELIAATESRDMARLEKIIQQCEHAGLADNGDLTRARRVLASLHEQALKTAIKERDLKALESAMEAAKSSCVYYMLHEGPTMQEAERLHSMLRRLKLYLHKILELKQMTVSEIHSYKRPRPLVHTVMKATYLLLGEQEQKLKQWEYIQSLLRRQGRDSIIRRIKEFDLVHMPLSSVNKAETHLKACNKDTVRQTSAGAGTFYVWSRNIINEGKTVDRENGKSKQAQRNN